MVESSSEHHSELNIESPEHLSIDVILINKKHNFFTIKIIVFQDCQIQ